MADASRDGNFVPTLLGVSSVDGTTPIKIWADETTHRLLVDSASPGPTGPTGPTDWITAPSGATSSGTAGQYSADSGYIYFCYASDTWTRTPVGTW